MFRAWLNRVRRRLWQWLFFRIVFGERAADGRLLPLTRIGASTCIEHDDQLVLADNVFIGHFNYIEASNGVTIDEGTQITNFVSIVTHSSHRSQRLMGYAYATSPADTRPEFVAGPVHIGAYCFIGPHSVIEAGTRLGKGCVVASHSRVRGEFAEFSLIAGSPAQRVGDARDADAAALLRHPQWRAHYEAWAGSGAQGTARDAPGMPREDA
jgi:acetyltransferase-like isoleucine patch superfamily enzyme